MGHIDFKNSVLGVVLVSATSANAFTTKFSVLHNYSENSHKSAKYYEPEEGDSATTEYSKRKGATGYRNTHGFLVEGIYDLDSKLAIGTGLKYMKYFNSRYSTENEIDLSVFGQYKFYSINSFDTAARAGLSASHLSQKNKGFGYTSEDGTELSWKAKVDPIILYNFDVGIGSIYNLNEKIGITLDALASFSLNRPEANASITTKYKGLDGNKRRWKNRYNFEQLSAINHHLALGLSYKI